MLNTTPATSLQTTHASHRSWYNPLNLQKAHSTSRHRQTQRASGITELLNQTIIAPISLTATLPLKFAQCLLSAHACSRADITSLERTAHVIQMVLALGESLILAILLFSNKDCPVNVISETNLCTAYLFINYLFTATLLLGWIPAEASKEPRLTNNDGSSSLHSDSLIQSRLASAGQNSLRRQTSSDVLFSDSPKRGGNITDSQEDFPPGLALNNI